eukprot:CAMPEP_0180784004 /NCGR_PEP_ID=MMETSP1038_2-20121128/49353_1 /TAXON_ID=632150 /ORGANISM="Azadinium spinosum, Strain 3D9" /LENGTH=33 /DNA_ID= /DNA_START= /DNA_END= /DNA_ORIENTATION=
MHADAPVLAMSTGLARAAQPVGHVRVSVLDVRV